MSRVVFLHEAADRLRAAATWLNAQPVPGSGITVFVPDFDDALRLDRLLWEQSPTGFMAHCNSDSPLCGETPIVLFKNAPARWLDPVVLNLSNEVPPQLEEIEQLVEVVGQDLATRTAGRKRYRTYQEAGFVIEARNIEKDPLT